MKVSSVWLLLAFVVLLARAAMLYVGAEGDVLEVEFWALLVIASVWQAKEAT